MLELKYIDTVRYEAGKPKAMFLLSDSEVMRNKHIAIFGTSLEAYFAFQYLEKEDFCVECFVDNNPRIYGSEFCGRKIKRPDEIWQEHLFIVIAMHQPKSLNEVLWQLKVHKQNEYAIAFSEIYHTFPEKEKQHSPSLPKIVLDIINKILCEGKTIDEVICRGMNVGPVGNIMFPIVELCWSTTWSHHLFQWFYDEFSSNSPGEISMLEIGPGKGLFSAMAHAINMQIDIEWLMFEMNEKSTEAVDGKYTWWPANQFKTYYGMIEEPGYRISKKFDGIVMTEVLEYFSANPRNTVRKIADMLKKDGVIYLSTPNWGHLPIYETYRDIPDWTDLESYKASYIGHTYQYSEAELRQILDECGLKVDRYALTEANHHNLLVSHK